MALSLTPLLIDANVNGLGVFILLHALCIHIPVGLATSGVAPPNQKDSL